MQRHRATDVLFDSESALQLVVSELAELTRPTTSCGRVLRYDDKPASARNRNPTPSAPVPFVPGAA